MDKHKRDDDGPKRWRLFYVGIVVLLIILVFAIALTLLTPKMGVFDSVIEGMTQTMAAHATQTAAP